MALLARSYRALPVQERRDLRIHDYRPVSRVNGTGRN